MNYLQRVFTNYKNIFSEHRELLFNLINFQIFLRIFGFITLLGAAMLFQRSLLDGSPFQLNYEALEVLLSTEVIFYGILYVVLTFFFLLLEKIGLNLILFQNEKNPKFLLKNIYAELIKNLRKIIYLFFLEFAIVSFIIGMFIYFSVFIYISIGFGNIFWVLESLVAVIFGYLLMKTYLFFIFVNFEVFYVEKNIFEAFSLSIRGINKKKTISHLAINYGIIISGIFTFDFIITSLMLLVGSIILIQVNIFTLTIVSAMMSFGILIVILSSFLLMSLLSIIEFQIYKKEIRDQEPNLTINPPDSLNINKTILAIVFTIMSIVVFIPLFFTLSDYQKLPTITAHRGASLQSPPNTISAFRKSIEQGVDAIELDLQETRDGRIIVFHDKNLRNKTGYDGNVYETDYETIASLKRIDTKDDNLEPEYIPTLEAVLNLVKDSDVELNLELKVYKDGHDYSNKIARVLEKWEIEQRVIITSLDINILEKFREHNSNIARGLIVTFVVGNIFDNDFEFISVNSQILSIPMIIRSKIYKKDLHVWIFNESDDIEEIIGFSPDNIIVDNTKEAMEAKQYISQLSNRKKLKIKIESIFTYLTGKIK